MEGVYFKKTPQMIILYIFFIFRKEKETHSKVIHFLDIPLWVLGSVSVVPRLLETLNRCMGTWFGIEGDRGFPTVPACMGTERGKTIPPSLSACSPLHARRPHPPKLKSHAPAVSTFSRPVCWCSWDRYTEKKKGSRELFRVKINLTNQPFKQYSLSD